MQEETARAILQEIARFELDCLVELAEFELRCGLQATLRAPVASQEHLCAAATEAR
jgi:hypothetical protein